MEFDGKCSLVTGGSGGIGLAVAGLLAVRGDTSSYPRKPPAATPALWSEIKADVTHEASVAAVRSALRRTDRLDILVTWVGIQRYGTRPTPRSLPSRR